MPLNNVLNTGKQINVQNTYSIGNSSTAKNKNIAPPSNFANNINNNELDVSNRNDNAKLRSSLTEDRDYYVRDIARNRQSNAPNRDINELKESVKSIENDQVQNIEETNATIAQNRGTLGVGARLVNNFLTNLSPNVGGKVDTVV